MNRSSWQGVFAVLVTPFAEDLTIDLDGVRNQVEFCAEAGAHGVVAPVVASEFFTLSDEERVAVYEAVGAANRGRMPFVAGVSGVSATHAASLARAATRHGATAVLAMPPYIEQGATQPQRALHYYQAIAAAVPTTTLVLQNAPPPLGAPLPADAVIELCRAIPSIRVIKEETAPNPHKLGAVVSAAPASVEGVFGGLGGIYFFNELARGAAGTMPACQFVDVVLEVYRRYREGRLDEARACFNDLLPAIVMERLYGVSFMKHCLMRRGVIASTSTRSSVAQLDAHDVRELDEIWRGLEPHMRVRFAATA